MSSSLTLQSNRVDQAKQRITSTQAQRQKKEAKQNAKLQTAQTRKKNYADVEQKLIAAGDTNLRITASVLPEIVVYDLGLRRYRLKNIPWDYEQDTTSTNLYYGKKGFNGPVWSVNVHPTNNNLVVPRQYEDSDWTRLTKIYKTQADIYNKWHVAMTTQIRDFKAEKNLKTKVAMGAYIYRQFENQQPHISHLWNFQQPVWKRTFIEMPGRAKNPLNPTYEIEKAAERANLVQEYKLKAEQAYLQHQKIVSELFINSIMGKESSQFTHKMEKKPVKWINFILEADTTNKTNTLYDRVFTLLLAHIATEKNNFTNVGNAVRPEEVRGRIDIQKPVIQKKPVQRYNVSVVIPMIPLSSATNATTTTTTTTTPTPSFPFSAPTTTTTPSTLTPQSQFYASFPQTTQTPLTTQPTSVAPPQQPTTTTTTTGVTNFLGQVSSLFTSGTSTPQSSTSTPSNLKVVDYSSIRQARIAKTQSSAQTRSTAVSQVRSGALTTPSTPGLASIPSSPPVSTSQPMQIEVTWSDQQIEAMNLKQLYELGTDPGAEHDNKRLAQKIYNEIQLGNRAEPPGLEMSDV